MDYQALIDDKDPTSLAMEVEGARLQVAEELGWPLAIAVGIIVYLKLDSWLAAIGLAGASYYGITYTYRQKFAKATALYMEKRFPERYHPSQPSNPPE